MNSPNTQYQLCEAYRNLLITLARDTETLAKEMEVMTASLATQPSKGKAAGVRTLINARRRQRARLLQILGMNKMATRLFFDSGDAKRVAKYAIT